MTFRCPHPHCGKPVEAEREGKPPARCPHCGLLMQPPKKKAPAKRPEIPSGEQPKTAKTASPAIKRTKSPPEQSPDIATAPSLPESLAKDPDPFGLKATPRQPTSTSPFGIGSAPIESPVQSRYLENARRRSYQALAISVVVGLGLVGTLWHFRGDIFSSKPTAPGAPEVTFKNIARNYEIAPPDKGWEKIERDGVDLAFVHSASDAQILIHSFAPGSVPTLSALSDEAAAELTSIFKDFKVTDRKGTTLASLPAMRISGEGKKSGQPIWAEATVLFHEGISYRLVFSVPSSRLSSVEGDFAIAADRFKILGPRPNWEAEMGPRLAAFVSQKNPYRLQAPSRDWKQTSEPDPANRLADLRLIDHRKDGILSVTPRQYDSLDECRESYVARQKSRYKTVTVERFDKSLVVNGHPAHRVTLTAKDDTLGSFLYCTGFVKVGATIHIIEGMAPADKSPIYEPIFVEAINSFEILDRRDWLASRGSGGEHKEVESAANASEKKKDAVASSEPSAKAELEKDRSKPASAETPIADTKLKGTGKGEQKGAASKQSEGTEKNEKKTDEEKPAPPKKSVKRRSLDDLEIDKGTPKKKDETPKKKEGKEESANPPPTIEG